MKRSFECWKTRWNMADYIMEKLTVGVRKAPRDIDSKLAPVIAGKLGLKHCAFDFHILGKSIDSRRSEPSFIYRLLISSEEKLPLPQASSEQLAALKKAELPLPEKCTLRNPVVVGTGPAGIFGALALALAGAEPVVIDRGFPVEQRREGWDKFLKTRELDEECNLLIGEGGAGAFSDGKLYTGTKDANRRFILEEMIAAGAPPEIAYLSRPHVGSDKLPLISVNLRRRIESLGGTFLFGKEVTDLLIRNGRCAGVCCGSEQISAPAVLLAPGLGGRNLVRNLLPKAAFAMKPFQMGCRIEHPQTLIDRCQYHTASRPAALGAAEYHLVSRPGDAWNVSSFCMCPGGTVVNATAWEKHSISNGMSNYARSGEFANSCLIATLGADYFSGPQEAYGLIERIEKSLFLAGGGDYTMIAQDAAAFLNGKTALKNSRSSCEVGIVPGRIDHLLITELQSALRAALKFFDRKCPGFIRDGKFIGVESCVSSPVRLERNEKCESTSLPGLYPAGEGVGAAGGILSGAADGLRCALSMLQ